MFKFNFNATDEDVSTEKEADERKWLKSEEIIPEEDIFNFFEEISKNDYITVFDCDSKHKINCVSVDLVIEFLKEKSALIIEAEKNHSDLVTGIYEGGLKIWEGTYDLAKFLLSSEVNMHNKKILDLGCGSGLLGILALLRNCTVYFQDYNPDVIKYITVPNVLLNSNADNQEEILNRCKFFSGDWKSFLEVNEENLKKEENKFDFILTSETIYNPDNYEKLCEIFKNGLKKGGAVFLAGKTYYFGVGGGLRKFEEKLDEYKSFECKTCWKCAEGLQREIIKITLKDDF